MPVILADIGACRLILWNGCLKPSDCIDRIVLDGIVPTTTSHLDRIGNLRAHYLQQETVCDHAILTTIAEVRRKLASPTERSQVPQILPYYAAYFLQAASIHTMFASQLHQVLPPREFVDAVRPDPPDWVSALSLECNLRSTAVSFSYPG
jgi:hypothetical protein